MIKASINSSCLKYSSLLALLLLLFIIIFLSNVKRIILHLRIIVISIKQVDRNLQYEQVYKLIIAVLHSCEYYIFSIQHNFVYANPGFLLNRCFPKWAIGRCWDDSWSRYWGRGWISMECGEKMKTENRKFWKTVSA